VWLAAYGEARHTNGRFWLDRRPRSIHKLRSTRRTDTPEARQRLWERMVEASGHRPVAPEGSAPGPSIAAEGTARAGDVTASDPERAVVVTTTIDASPRRVWEDVRHIESHVTWMQDASAIRFIGDSTEGVGTRFECDTRVGPFSLTDVMEITSWEDERRMGVRHVGLVEGVGEFTLCELGDGRTRFRWEEDLTFPARLGGPVGAWLARPVLGWIWSRNLARLKARIESGAS
jgi:uncharacterized protein YndB with AHSA1/START domain